MGKEVMRNPQPQWSEAKQLKAESGDDSCVLVYTQCGTQCVN